MSFQWLSLVAIIWLQSINGTNSNFPAYSSELKKILSISQLQLNNLAFASDAGKLLGWISGVAAAHLPLPLLLLIASSLGVLGYGLQSLFLTRPLSYLQVFTLTVVAGNSICWINTVCYIVAIRNFPFDRQIAIGISTSYVGLSAKIYTDVVALISPTVPPHSKATDFLLLNAVLPLLVCFVAAPFTRDVEVGKSRRLTGGFVAVVTITVLTGLFAVITSSLPRVPPLVVVGGIVGLLMLPLVTPLVERVAEKLRQKCWIVAREEGGDRGDIEVEMGPLLMVRKLNFWVYYLVYLLGGTVGLVYLNNLGQIAESRGFSRISWLVSLASAFGFFGRLLPSLLDYFFAKRVTRASAMGAMTSPMCGAFFILVMNKHNLPLFISTAIISTCSGAISSIAVSTTTELFGTKNFGMNHNILISNIPIGSFVFGDFAAFLYNKGRAHGEENCMGEKCYQTTFLIWACFCFVATLLALLLHSKTKKLYSHK